MAELSDLDWTPLSLKVYLERVIEDQRVHFEMQLAEQRRATEITFTEREKAITKAEVAAEKRFEGVNEFRQQLGDQALTFMPREVADAQFNALNERLRKIESQQSAVAGAASANRRSEDRLQPWMIWAMGLGVTVFLAVAVFAANFLTASP